LSRLCHSVENSKEVRAEVQQQGVASRPFFQCFTMRMPRCADAIASLNQSPEAGSIAPMPWIPRKAGDFASRSRRRPEQTPEAIAQAAAVHQPAHPLHSPLSAMVSK